MMSQLERAYQNQGQAYQAGFNTVLQVLRFIAPLTPFKADDAARNLLDDIKTPGKPTMEEIADDIYKPSPDNNPHRDLAPFTAVNNNPGLQGEPHIRLVPAEPVEGVDQRMVACPPSYMPLFTPDSVPWVHQKPDGYEFSVEWIAGICGFLTDPCVNVYPGKYLLKAVVDTQFSERLDNYSIGSSVGIDGKPIALVDQPIEAGLKEYAWSVVFERAGLACIEVVLKSQWGLQGGKFVIRAIRLETLPDDWNGTSIIIK